MEELKSYWEAVKGVALDTFNGVINAEEEEIKVICTTIISFGVLSVFVGATASCIVASCVIGVAYANGCIVINKKGK